MTVLQAILAEFHGFGLGARARALHFLKTGVLDVTPNRLIMAKLDRWTHRIERAGPGARERVLRAIEEAGAA